MMVASYPINSEQLEIQVFGCFTRDLHLIANCLKAKGVTTIAMESTGGILGRIISVTT